MNKYDLLKKKIKNVEMRISKNRNRIQALNQEQKILEEQLLGMKKLEKRYEEIEKATDQFLLSSVEEIQNVPTSKSEKDLVTNQESSSETFELSKSENERIENDAKGN